MYRRALLSRMALFCLSFVVFASLLTAAQEKKEVAPPPAPSAEDEALQKAVGAPVDPKTYLIGAEDVLNIKVWREPDLSGSFLVRPDGKITLPLIGDLQAGGMTPEKLTAVLTEGLSKFVTSPVVIVQIAQVNSKKYYVVGQVARPGSYSMVTPITVLDAMTIAGGPLEFAKKKDIAITRGPKRYKFNYEEVMRGKNMGQNILLENGDRIIVR